MKKAPIILLTFIILPIFAVSHVLSFDGDSDYVEIKNNKSSGEGKKIAVEPLHVTSLQVERGKNFKKGTWKNYTTLDGLAQNAVTDIYRSPNSVIWFATEGGGVSRYDGKEFVNFTTKDGLGHNWGYAIHGASDQKDHF